MLLISLEKVFHFTSNNSEKPKGKTKNNPNPKTNVITVIGWYLCIRIRGIYESNPNAKNTRTYKTYFRNRKTISKLDSFLVKVLIIFLGGKVE